MQDGCVWQCHVSPSQTFCTHETIFHRQTFEVGNLRAMFCGIWVSIQFVFYIFTVTQCLVLSLFCLYWFSWIPLNINIEATGRHRSKPSSRCQSSTVQFWDSMGKAAYMGKRVCLKLGDLKMDLRNKLHKSWYTRLIQVVSFKFSKEPTSMMTWTRGKPSRSLNLAELPCELQVLPCEKMFAVGPKQTWSAEMIAICGASSDLNHSVLGTHAVVRVVHAILRLSGLPSGNLT
jgi:hypothetical protein